MQAFIESTWVAEIAGFTLQPRRDERCSVDLSRDYAPFEGFEISDYIPGHVTFVSDYIARARDRSERLHILLYTEVLLCTVINRPKSRIWVNFRHFSKNSLPVKQRLKVM